MTMILAALLFSVGTSQPSDAVQLAARAGAVIAANKVCHVIPGDHFKRFFIAITGLIKDLSTDPDDYAAAKKAMSDEEVSVIRSDMFGSVDLTPDSKACSDLKEKAIPELRFMIHELQTKVDH